MNNVFSRASRIMNQLQVVLSIMVRYGIFVFAAVLRREAAERVAKPGPFQETAPAGLWRRGCTALPRLFQANAMNSVPRSRHARHAMFGPRLKNHGFGPQAAFGAVKTGRFLQKESSRPSGIGPARCGPGILIFCPEVMYFFPVLGRKMGERNRPHCRALPVSGANRTRDGAGVRALRRIAAEIPPKGGTPAGVLRRSQPKPGEPIAVCFS